MNLLRHMAMDYVAHRLSGDRGRPAGFARPRPSLFHALWDDIQSSGPLGQSGRDSAMRASDADREEVAASLKRHYAEGRLSTDELTARVESAYGTRCLADLTALTRDLPEPPPSDASPPAHARRKTRPVLGLAALGLSAFLVVALASLMPAEVWAPFLMLMLALAPLALVVILPLALFAIPLLWLRGSRGPTRVGPGHGRHSIFTQTQHGWVGIRRL